MYKEKKLNEGLFDTYRSIRGAIRSGMAGMASARGTDNRDAARNLLEDEIEAAWNNFAISLKKAGYSPEQISDMKDSFDHNIKKLIDYAQTYYPNPNRTP